MDGLGAAVGFRGSAAAFIRGPLLYVNLASEKANLLVRLIKVAAHQQRPITERLGPNLAQA
jgi:hypothetical protein